MTADGDMAPLGDAFVTWLPALSPRAGLLAWRKEAWCPTSTLSPTGGRVRSLLRDRRGPRDSSRRRSRRCWAAAGRPAATQQRARARLTVRRAGGSRSDVGGRRPARLDRCVGGYGGPLPRVTVGYLPGLSMRRIADLYPGEAKTDARDAYVIADAGTEPAAHPSPGRHRGAHHRRARGPGRVRRRPGHRADPADQPAARRAAARAPGAGTVVGQSVPQPGRAAAAGRHGTPASIAALGSARLRKTIAAGSPGSRPGLQGRSSWPSPSRPL